MIADAQLQDFKESGSRAPVMCTGLWSFCRHPNYFGELSYWVLLAVWGYFHGAPWWHVAGPFNIVALFVFYSVKAMEDRMLANPKRASAYQEYQKRTSVLIPFLW